MNFLITILIRGCGSKDKTNLRNKYLFDGFSFHLISRMDEMGLKTLVALCLLLLLGMGLLALFLLFPPLWG